jgi:hypothetical protein
MKRSEILFTLCFGALLFMLGGCLQEDDFITDSSARLDFSRDTIFFDTVFTTVGSATRILKVYNPNKQPIQISRVYIEGGENTVFRLNVDGISGNEQEKVEIAAEDSLYIFVEANINPDDPVSVSPFIIGDHIVFETNGNLQRVALEAWGQNANYLPGKFNKGNGVIFTCDFDEVVLDDPKPYVIHGILVIDSCTLVLPPGTELYIHGGLVRAEDASGIRFFYNDGRLVIGSSAKIRSEGTLEEPVIIQGDRLEGAFGEEPGQWYGLILSAGSKGNEMNYTTVKNSILGVAADSASELTLRNSQMLNSAGNGLVGIHAEITAENCLLANNGSEAAYLLYGGNYTFTYCTLASYGVSASALTLSNVFCLDPFCTEFRTNALDASFTNCVIYGSSRDEINLVDLTGGQTPFNYQFDHCVVRVDQLDDEPPYDDFFPNHCDPCINADPSAALFFDADENDYHLDTLSVAEGQAIPINDILIDLEDKMRDPVSPDIGCFEYE